MNQTTMAAEIALPCRVIQRGQRLMRDERAGKTPTVGDLAAKLKIEPRDVVVALQGYPYLYPIPDHPKPCSEWILEEDGE